MRTRWFLTLAGTVVLSACSGLSPEAEPPQMCTLMGCLDSVTVILEGNLPVDYTLELAPPEGPPVSVHCVSGENAEPIQVPTGRCEESGGTFIEFAPGQVHATLTWDRGSVEADLTPVYVTTQPNGPDCPPVCRAGSVTLSVP